MKFSFWVIVCYVKKYWAVAMATVEERISDLEKTLHKIYGGVAVGVLLILGFFGYTSLHQIPSEAKKIMPEIFRDWVKEHDPKLIDRIKENEQLINESAESAVQYSLKAEDAASSASSILASLNHSKIEKLVVSQMFHIPTTSGSNPWDRPEENGGCKEISDAGKIHIHTTSHEKNNDAALYVCPQGATGWVKIPAKIK